MHRCCLSTPTLSSKLVQAALTYPARLPYIRGTEHTYPEGSHPLMSTGLDPQQSDLTTGFVPFPADRAEEYRRAGYWTGRSLDSILGRRRRAVARPRRCHRRGRHLHVRRTGRARRPDRVGIGRSRYRGGRPGAAAASEFAQFAVALFGLLRAGAVPVMCLPGHRYAELSHFAEVSGAVGLVIPDRVAGFDYRELAQALVNDNPRLRHVFVDGEPGPFESWSELADFDGPVRRPRCRSTRVRPPCCWCPAARPDCRS